MKRRSLTAGAVAAGLIAGVAGSLLAGAGTASARETTYAVYGATKPGSILIHANAKLSSASFGQGEIGDEINTLCQKYEYSANGAIRFNWIKHENRTRNITGYTRSDLIKGQIHSLPAC